MRLLLALTSLFLIFSCTGFSQSKTFTFKGQVHSYGENLKGAKIEVLEAGNLIYETTTSGSGKFSIDLQSEREYTVEISKEELQTKIIWIKTKHTEELEFKVPVFDFDVYLKKEKNTPYDELLEIPVTLIKYNPEKKAFYMDKTYEDAIANKEQRIKDNTLQIRR
ncbi:MAG: carboxypeptidase regulatory-like domain-containing protein [Bacteroidetes bacterium]|nr:MAG: carboxypeptidase regulatory-like domain-containing protein [Bacteroidota bacterium]MBL1143312.1 carboxypeptidase regulatory-like domain-containing protein [Bacteroidota bacterium]NOG56114.1 carboxypeptidase regulatory-like domain-containing protein [Bacteroidota bacterium]